jgi:plastocyanin
MKVALIVAAIAAALAVPAASAGTTLNGTVGPGFSISLTQGGKKVTTLKAGTYTIVVNDKASIHDFHLTGPGVNKVTSVSGKGTQTWKVTLKKGTYKYMCDPHAAFMHGSFKVT